ncbi:DUF5675 family protein [Xylanibacter oryzae]|uniref:DUF5675 family protein n=1 Tax=Xylanibacter oryzae TaxID=185293 RepID=UPI00055D118A|nr:DUF5675 family protein [Xylanibacter oryzae]
MEITITRIAKKADYTIGRLTINGHRICDTLEPHCINWATETKIKGKTAIPEGRYRIMMKMSSKFEKQMPFLMDVPHFKGVMIHQGNTPKNTQGCIIVGYNTIRGLVLKSRQAMESIQDYLDTAIETKQEIWCVIK